MSCILHIETSTAVCSVAVSEDGQNIFVKEDLKGPSHAVSLGVFVDEALSFIDSHAIPLDAVAGLLGDVEVILDACKGIVQVIADGSRFGDHATARYYVSVFQWQRAFVTGVMFR